MDKQAQGNSRPNAFYDAMEDKKKRMRIRISQSGKMLFHLPLLQMYKEILVPQYQQSFWMRRLESKGFNRENLSWM